MTPQVPGGPAAKLTIEVLDVSFIVAKVKWENGKSSFGEILRPVSREVNFVGIIGQDPSVFQVIPDTCCDLLSVFFLY